MPDNVKNTSGNSGKQVPVSTSADAATDLESSTVEITELIDVPEIQQNPYMNTAGAAVSIAILVMFVFGAIKSVSARELQNLSWVFLIIAAIFYINGMEKGHIGEWQIELIGSISFGANIVATIALFTWAFLLVWARSHMSKSSEAD